jgi:hypothetical protein
MAHNTHSAGRRRFLKGAAVGAAGALVPGAGAGPLSAEAAQTPPAQSRSVPASPDSAQLLADTAPPAARENLRIVEHPASDFMVDVIKRLGFEYVAANPGSSFEGLHESIINYGENKMPELLTCCHESRPSRWHGYARSKASRCWRSCTATSAACASMIYNA